MYQKIIDFVNEVFKDAPLNSVVGFTKKGFISSISKKYESYLQKGYSEEDAFNLAVAESQEIYGVANDMAKFMGRKCNTEAPCEPKNENRGDETFTYSSDGGERKYETAKKPDKEGFCETPDTNRKMGYFTSIFWPLIIAGYFLYSFFVPSSWNYSWIIFVIGGALTCIVRFFVYKSKAAKKHALIGLLWLLVVAIYLSVSIFTERWQYTWLIFPVAAAVQCAINLFTAKTLCGMQGAISGVVWLLVVSSYFAVSFLTGLWHVTWVIFIIGIALQTVAKLIVDKAFERKRKKSITE